MKAIGWKTYRTRFLVNAKQLSSNLSFIDHLGRQHCGQKGDYLVESSDGVISIAPREIFEDIYVQIAPDEAPMSGEAFDQAASYEGLPRTCPFRIEPLKIQRIKHQQLNCSGATRSVHHDGPARYRRKGPQPAQASASRIGMM